MSILKSILYGLVSGVAEFLPISSRAHQSLLNILLGAPARDPLQDLLVHIGLVISVFICCREYIQQLKSSQKSALSSRRRRSRTAADNGFYDLRLLKTAAVPLLIGLLLRFTTVKFESNLLALMLFLLCNAFILLLAEHSSHGNRDSRTMTGLDGILMGILGSLSAFPGISRTGIISAYTTVRGADSQNAVNWAVLLAIPALLFASFFDIFCAVRYGLGTISLIRLVQCILSGAAAFIGGYLGISVLKVALNHSGFGKFSYYCIGAALFSFILYLIT